MSAHADPSILPSWLVSEHVDLLVAVAADHSAFRNSTIGVLNALRDASTTLHEAAQNDQSVDVIRTWISDQRGAADEMMVRTAGLVDRLQQCAIVGGRIVGELTTLEHRLASADIDVDDTKRAYDKAALLENVPVLDAVERWARSPVEQAYQDYQIANAARAGVIDDLRMLSTQWLTLLPEEIMGAIASPAGLQPSDEGASDWKHGKSVDVSKAKGAQTPSLWKDVAAGTDEVRQGSIGDCYFCAAIAALASTPAGMKYLQSMIIDNGNGTYTITFGDGRVETVDAKVIEVPVRGGTTEAGARIPADGAFWFVILEKAYAAYKGSYHDLGNGTLTSAQVYADIGLGGTESRIDPSMSDASVQHLLSSVNSGVPVTAGGRVGNILSDMGSDAGAGHEFSVIDYDPHTQLVTLRNPWGTNVGHTPINAVGTNSDATGVFTLTLADFKKEFREITVAGRFPS